MATLACFLEGQVLIKSGENHCFYRGKFQPQVSIERVALVLSEWHVHAGVEKTHWFYRGNANRKRRSQRVPLLPSVWHVQNLLPVRKFQSQRKRRCFKRFLIFFGKGLCCRCASNILEDSVLPVGDFVTPVWFDASFTCKRYNLHSSIGSSSL